FLRQVTYGKKHRFVSGPWWRQMLGRMPTNFTTPFRLAPQIDFTKDDTLVAWVEWRNGTNQMRYPNWLAVLDSNGLQSSPAYIERNILDRSNNVVLSSFHLRSFPRNERT